MTKDRINISIDKELLEKSKKHIPNLSAFFEECLKYYVGDADGMVPILNDQEILDEIGKLQAKLFMNRENKNVAENIKKAEQFEMDKKWRFLWNDYQRRLIPDERLMNEAVEVLGIDADLLEDILDEVYENKDRVNVDTWESVKKWYDEEVVE